MQISTEETKESPPDFCNIMLGKRNTWVFIEVEVKNSEFHPNMNREKSEINRSACGTWKHRKRCPWVAGQSGYRGKWTPWTAQIIGSCKCAAPSLWTLWTWIGTDRDWISLFSFFFFPFTIFSVYFSTLYLFKKNS